MGTLTSFTFGGIEQGVCFVETTPVTTGVECDVYTFYGDETKDLGIIRVAAGCKTPLQKVVGGDKTIEGYISGQGKLTVTKLDGTTNVHNVGGEKETPFSLIVQVGETMQWEADENSELVAYELCYPPYNDGRFENL